MKTTVLQLVDELSFGQADAAQASYFYDQAMYELLEVSDVHTEAALISATAETATFTLPPEAVNPLMVFYDDQQLDRLSIEEAEAVYGMAWRDQVGFPACFVVEREADRVVRLVPAPGVTSKDFVFVMGAPFGVDFPEYAIAVISTTFAENINDLYDLPLAFSVLSREFTRESVHQDRLFGETCRVLSSFLFSLLMRDRPDAKT